MVSNIEVKAMQAQVTRELRQDPPPIEAILAIFGRRALFFFFVWKLSKNMNNDTTFVHMRSGDHLGDAKMSKRAPRSVEFNFFLLIARDRNGFRRMKREGQIYKTFPQIFNFCQGT